LHDLFIKNMKKASSVIKTEGIFVLKNLLIALILGVIGVVGVSLWLRSYTEHGIEVDVPNLVGLHINEAAVLADSVGCEILVIDSTYSKKVPLGTIVEQTPIAFSHAKHGRVIYVTVNAQSARAVPLPDLHDTSFRQAEATLHTVGLRVANYIYEPSEFKDIILDVRLDGQSIEPGQRVTEGAAVTLVIGKGKGTEKVIVPNLCGKNLIEARSLLLGSYLTLGSYQYDVPPTEETESLYVVYEQLPLAGSSILEGSLVNIRLTTDLEKAVNLNVITHEDEEEDFF